MSLHASHFGHGAGRSDRRRRLMAEESSADGQTAATAILKMDRVVSPPVHKSEHYGDAEFLDQQPRLSDLVPQRPLALILLFLGGVTVIVGLECMYAWLPDLAAWSGSRLATIDLAGPSNLGTWFSSLLLLAASVVAIIVYTLRRHKTDDYHGRYRVWLWAGGCWFLLATDATARLHEGFQEILTAATGTRLLGDGSVWWVGTWFLLLTAIGVRLLVDTWSCRLSSTALILGWICYVTAFAAHLGWLLPDGRDQILLRQGAEMTGNLLLLAAMTLHARYVLADARGLLPRKESAAKPKKPAKKQVASDEPAGRDQEAVPTTPRVVSPAQNDRPKGPDDGGTRSSSNPTATTVAPSPAPRASALAAKVAAVQAKPAAAPTPSIKATPTPVAKADEDLDPGESSGDQKLSKADRKALKKRLLEERLKREQRTAGKW